MSSILPWFRNALAVGSLALLGATAAQAEAVSFFVPYEGGGNVSVFDAAAGTGGWVGSIVQSPDPAVTSPLSLVSVVLFTVDELSKTLSGTFEFTTTDLLSTLFGELSGSFVEEDILTAGGQFSIDYTVQGGTGQFSRATGFGLAFVDFDPRAAGDNYRESGLLLFEVPTTTTLALVALGVLGLALQRRTDAAAPALHAA
jgi:hypothetical protein